MKILFLNPPVNHQNDFVWSAGKKRDVDKVATPGSGITELMKDKKFLVNVAWDDGKMRNAENL